MALGHPAKQSQKRGVCVTEQITNNPTGLEMDSILVLAEKERSKRQGDSPLPPAPPKGQSHTAAQPPVEAVTAYTVGCAAHTSPVCAQFLLPRPPPAAVGMKGKQAVVQP